MRTPPLPVRASHWRVLPSKGTKVYSRLSLKALFAPHGAQIGIQSIFQGLHSPQGRGVVTIDNEINPLTKSTSPQYYILPSIQGGVGGGSALITQYYILPSIQGGVGGGSVESVGEGPINFITMNKITKYSIVGIIVAGCAALAYNAFMPKENDELNQAPKSAGGRQGKTLNVRAVVVEQQLLTDGLSMSGSLVPDEEVSLSFETSGKITDIFFKEGSMVEKGQLLAKINDAPLQAELRRKEAQLRLMQDRVYRAKALLENSYNIGLCEE